MPALNVIRSILYPLAEADELRKKWGKNELEEKGKSKLKLFIEQARAAPELLHWRPRARNQRLARPCADHDETKCFK